MNTYYGVNTWSWTSGSDVLYHHGILGQRWGKRNGPPYPLTGSAHSVAEKRLKKDNKGALQSWGLGRKSTSRPIKFKSISSKRGSSVVKTMKKKLKDAKVYLNEHPKVKKALVIGGTILVAAISAQAGYEIWKAVQTSKLMTAEKLFDSILENNRHLYRNMSEAISKENAVKRAISLNKNSDVAKVLKSSLEEATSNVKNVDSLLSANRKELFETQRRIKDLRYTLKR